jgi:hydrophobic/amphiphilic exporter-1 (mainly G- bacteria), HAE1 family
MSLASLSVKRGVTFTMLFIIVAGFGLLSLARLKIDLYPDLDFPIVLVATEYEGAGPREIEDLVTRPIESAVASVDGVKKVSSTSKQGVSVVIVEFKWGTNMKQAEIDVRKYIDLIKSALPTEIKSSLIFAVNPSMQPVAFLGLSGPYPVTRLRELAEEKIEPMIERIEGIALADTVGGGKREIQIQLDPRRAAAAAVSPLQLVNALRAENLQLPGGTFDQGGWEFTIQAKGKFTNVKQIEEVVVGLRQGVPVRLRDVATVHDGLKEETQLIRNNGQSSIMMIVRKQSDANTVQAVRALKAAIPEIEQKAARGVKVTVLFDQGEIVEQSIGNLGTTGWQAILLTFLVLFFFLRELRPSLIVALSIPLSVVATFSAMDALGLTLNVISMSGLALAIGMLVDNSIVVQESIYLRAEQGDHPHEAAINGTKEVAMAITASTLTTLAVFLPILFVPGIAGKMFRDMTITVCVSLTVSILVAMTAVPLASSRLLASAALRRQRKHGPLHRWLGRVNDRMIAGYGRVLDGVLANRKKTYVIVTLATIGSILFAFRIPTNFFPNQDVGLIQINVEGPVGSSLDVTDAGFRRLEDIVQQHVPERRVVNVDIGTGEGFSALFAKGAYAGVLRVKLKDRKERTRKQADIENDLRERFGRVPGLTTAAQQRSFTGAAGDVIIELYGQDLVQAHDLGMKIKELLKGIKGTADVTFSLESGKPEYDVVFDRARLSALGLSAATVSQTISTFFAGKIASIYQEGGYEYDIRVRGPKEYRRDERSLRALLLVTPSGEAVPLGSVATVRPSVGPTAITRRDQQRMVSVSCAVPGKDLGRVVKELEGKLKAYPWPESFTYRIGGEAEDFQDSFRWLGLALLASIILVYMVMASQFESFIHPFVILFSIPLSAVGIVLALGLTGTTLSVIALIGVVILGGIVVNNAIVLIDYINQLRARGVALLPAVAEGCRRRLRPVLMTALTTILGMLPLALELGEGAETWSPMARTVMGGLTASTALTLLVIPALYATVELFREKRRRRREARVVPAGGDDAAAA